MAQFHGLWSTRRGRNKSKVSEKAISSEYVKEREKKRNKYEQLPAQQLTEETYSQRKEQNRSIGKRECWCVSGALPKSKDTQNYK